MSEILKGFDFLGIEPKLTTFSKTKYKTKFGAILSLSSLCVILTISAYFIMQTIQRKSLNVLYNEDLNRKAYYNYTDTPFFIAIANGTTTPPPNENNRLYNIKSKYAKFFYKNFSMEFKDYDLVPCGQSSIKDHKFFNLFENLEIVKNYGQCVETNGDNIDLYGVVGDFNDYSYLYYYIYRCINETNGPICAPQEEIDYYLGSSYILMGMKDYIINSKNSSSPGEPIANSVFMFISTTINKYFFVTFKNIEYTTDFGFLFEDFHTDYFNIYDGMTQYVDFQKEVDPGLFAALNVSCSKRKSIYNRNYLKFQNLLANIGGIANGILLIARFLESYLIKNYFLIDLANEIFTFKSDEKNNNIEIIQLPKTNFNLTSKSDLNTFQKPQIDK